MCIELYPHNQETYDKIIAMWKTTNRVAAIQPTGTGKSFLILKCVEYFEDQNKVVLAPSNYILEQLVEQNKGDIKNTQLITYATLQNMTEEELIALNPSLICLDEFHRCGAEQWGLGVQRLLELFSNTKILGTSATPIRYLDNARDMSDELFDGNVACNMTLPEAIVEGILPMPKYVSALYTFEDEANNMIDKVNKSKNSDEEKKLIIKDIEKLKNKLDKSKGIPKILQKYITNYSGKYIIFCKNKEHIDEMKDTVIEWFKSAKSDIKISSYEVYSQSKESDKQLELFIKDNSKNILNLLFSIDMLNEGVHINDLDGVILLRPTVSPIIYYQQIGRAIDAGRKESPLVLDFVNNFDNIKIDSFKSDLMITAREYYKSSNDGNLTNKDDFISKFIVYDETYDVISLFNKIENKLICNWDLNILAADQFIKRECHSNIPRKHVEIINGIEINLGEFRHYLLSNKFVSTNSRNEQLKKIGFILEKKIQNQYNFDFWFDLIKKIKNETGNANVIHEYVYNGFNVGNWQNSIRNKYKKGILKDKEVEKLEKIGFVFDIYEHRWNLMYNELKDFYNEYGNSNVPQSYVINGENLGKWRYMQKHLYKNGKLSKEKINKLEKLKFDFEMNPKTQKTKTISKRTICLETKDIFISFEEASVWCMLKAANSINNNIKGRTNSAGKHPETGEPLHWMYYEDYVKQYGEVVS